MGRGRQLLHGAALSLLLLAAVAHAQQQTRTDPSNVSSKPPPAAPKQPKGGFADEDDLLSDEEAEFEAPPAKKPRLGSTKSVSSGPEKPKEKSLAAIARETTVSNALTKMLKKGKGVEASTAGSAPSSAAAVASAKEHPILSTARQVSDFATQFVKIEAENVQLRKDLTEKVQAANRLAEEAWQANEDLKAELAEVKKELAKAKEAEEDRKKEEASSEKALQSLRKGVESLLAAADIPVDRADEQQVKAMDDPISFAAESVARVQTVLLKAKDALSTLFGLVFPKLPQNRMLEELAQAFIVDGSSRIEVLKRTSRILGALLAFQLLMGYGIEADLEGMMLELPKTEDGTEVDLTKFTARARACARQLIELVEVNKAKKVGKDTPSASAQTAAP